MKRNFRILCGILAILMVLSLCACGNKNEGDKPNKETIPSVDLQKYYEEYFEKPEFAGNSIKIATDDGMKVEIVAAKDGGKQVVMGTENAEFGLYTKDNNTIYVNALMPDEESGDMIDTWYRYNPTEPEEGEAVFEDFSTDDLLEDVKLNKENVDSIRYEKTENGYDYITLFAKNDTIEDGVIMETNGSSDEDGIEEDVVGDTVPVNEDLQKITVIINSETHKITSVTATIDNMPTTIEFFDVNTIEFDEPTNAEECDEEELAMLMMAVMFSMMETVE